MRFAVLIFLVASCAAQMVVGDATTPRPVLNFVDTTYPDTSGYAVVTQGCTSNPTTDGDALQTKLAAATCGTVFKLSAGCTYRRTGGLSFYLPTNLSCSSTSQIVVTTDAVSGTPAVGTRFDPNVYSASNLPKLNSTTANVSVFGISGPMNWVRFALVEFTWGDIVNTDAVTLDLDGSSCNSVANCPSHVLFDRVYLHPSTCSTDEAVRGIGLAGSYVGVVDSWLECIWINGYQSQGVGGWSGSGPWLIRNNFIEGLGETILIGGARNRIAGGQIQDITITKNYIYKRPSWNGLAGHANACNLLEFKDGGRRVLVEANVLDNSWVGCGQPGYAFEFYPECVSVASGGPFMPHNALEDFTVQYNLARHIGWFVDVTGRQYNEPGVGGCVTSNSTRRFLFSNNLALDIKVANGSNIGLQNTSGGTTIAFDHNTAFGDTTTKGIYGLYGSQVSQGFQFTNNIISTDTNTGAGGICDANASGGSNPFSSGSTACFNLNALSSTWSNNVLYRDTYTVANSIPGTGWTPSSQGSCAGANTCLDLSDSTNCNGGTYTWTACALNATSYFSHSSVNHACGTTYDCGADITTLNSKISGVIPATVPN